ncbi:MAG: ATPase [Chloroflexi bacterium]|nr:MAG: ATPase [Chloroflexota bacterium]
MNLLTWDDILTLEADRPAAEPFVPLVDLPLVVLVGLTGVGKSTTLEHLAELVAFSLLPNRRALTDHIIIAGLQKADGHTPFPVKDRLERFSYTARYRARHPGGMAHALSRIAVHRHRLTGPLVFDGLRGLDEVQAAARLFRQARFVVLDAPDIVRLTRLLHRGDSFDQAQTRTASPDGSLTAALLNIPHVTEVFSPAQVEQVARLVQTGAVDLQTAASRLAIIIEERKNYDSTAARGFLTDALPPHRVLVIDTAGHPASAVARQIADWLYNSEF